MIFLLLHLYAFAFIFIPSYKSPLNMFSAVALFKPAEFAAAAWYPENQSLNSLSGNAAVLPLAVVMLLLLTASTRSSCATVGLKDTRQDGAMGTAPSSFLDN